MALLAGCVQPVLDPDIDAAAVRLLTRHGVEMVVAPGQGCCGALAHHMGKDEDALTKAKINIEAWENEIAKDGLDAIVISAAVTPQSLELRVRDFGGGLPAMGKGRERDLFEKFTRGQSESATRGVGLGLAICKAIVEAHQGAVAVTSEAGQGAEFVITVPQIPLG